MQSGFGEPDWLLEYCSLLQRGVRGLSQTFDNCHFDAGLLVAESFDWVHTGGADGGKQARDYADDSEDSEGDEHDGG